MGVGYECGGIIPPRDEHGTPTSAVDAYLERVRLRREAEQAAARRTRLHYFGLAGGRR